MSPEGQAKVNLILELKNRIKTGLTQAKANLNSTVQDMKAKLSSLKQSHIESFKAMGAEVPGFGRVMSMLGNPYVLITAGLLALGAAGMKAAAWSSRWQTGMAEVNVTAQLSKKNLDILSDKIVDIGKRNVAPLEEIPAAFNRIISSGLDVNTSLKVLEPTLRAAKAGFTDIETVAAAGVGVMASSGEEINKVYDILFATLNKGNAKFQDVASYLPKIIPLAKGAGFALDETAGAWAFLTAQGQKAEQATTNLMGMIKQISNVDTAKNLKGLGVNVYDGAGKMRPMVDIIQQLSTKLNGLSDAGKAAALDKAGIVDMEAKGAILAMIQNVGKLKEITDYTRNSTGELGRAYDAAATSMDDWKIGFNTFKATIVKPIGDAVLWVVGKVGTGFKNVMEWMANTFGTIKNYFVDLYNNSQMFRDVLSAIGTVGEWAFKLIMAPLKMLWNLLGFVWKGISAVGSTIAKWFSESGIGKAIGNFYNKIRPYFIWLKEIVGQVTNILYKFVTFDFKGAWKGIKEFKMPDIDEIRNRQAKEIADRKNAKNKEEENPFAAGTGKVPGTDMVVPNGSGSSPAGKESIDKITGSAKQIRNIEVKIDSFVKGMNISNQNTQSMSDKQLEEFFTNMFLRVVRNLETSYQ